MKDELGILKQQSSTTKNKIKIFIQLITKYAKKLLAISQTLPDLSTNNTPNINLLQTINVTLSNTIGNFYNMIYNPKLNESIFDISLIDDNDNNNNAEYFKEFRDLIERYEEKINLLVQENNEIKLKLSQAEQSSKINEEIENKISNLKKENESYLCQIKLKNGEIDFLNKNNSSLQNELKNREDKILYLESLLSQANKSKANDIQQYLLKNDGINQYLEKDQNNEYDNNSNIEDININIKDDANEASLNNSNIDEVNQKPHKIKKEIDVLDQEIAELQNQLKTMLKRKNV